MTPCPGGSATARPAGCCARRRAGQSMPAGLGLSGAVPLPPPVPGSILHGAGLLLRPLHFLASAPARTLAPSPASPAGGSHPLLLLSGAPGFYLPVPPALPISQAPR